MWQSRNFFLIISILKWGHGDRHEGLITMDMSINAYGKVYMNTGICMFSFTILA